MAVALVVVLIVAIVIVVLRKPDTPPTALPPSAVPPTGAGVPPTTKKPRPEFQDASCPDVQLISIPGTWESSPQLDPFNPTQFPIALLLNVTNPIRAAVRHRPAGDLHGSRTPRSSTIRCRPTSRCPTTTAAPRAPRAAVKAMTDMNNRCPLTSYVLVGFSQGAVIAGDIASDIGNGRGPVDEDLVLGVTLIADGRRQDGVGQDVGPNPDGQGAEITLHEVPTLSALGLTMTGPRPGGFGMLNDRTNEICATGDLICAAPESAFNITQLPRTLEVLSGGAGQPVHAMYATPRLLESRRCTGHAVDTGLGAERDR